MTTFAKKEIWLGIDVDNQQISIHPRFFRGGALTVRIALFKNGTLLSVDNLDSLVFSVNSLGDLAGDAVMQASDSAPDDTLTEALWLAQGGAHATLNFTDAQTLLNLGGMSEREFQYVVYGINKITGQRAVHSTGRLTVIESGATGEAPEIPDGYYTKVESDARYPRKSDAIFTVTGGSVLRTLGDEPSYDELVDFMKTLVSALQATGAIQ